MTEDAGIGVPGSPLPGPGRLQRTVNAVGAASGSPVFRRAGWTIVDQMLSSASNFGLALILAHALDRRGFGAFSLGFATYLLSLGCSRALGSAVLQIRYSAVAEAEQRGAIQDAMGVPLVVSGALLLPLSVVAALVGGQVGDAMLALAMVSPALLMQDGWRFAFFTMGRAPAAALNDLVWVIVEFGAVAVLLALDRVTVTSAILAWGGAAYVAAFVGLVQAGVRPTPKRGLAWLSSHRDLALPGLGELLMISGTWPAILLIVGAVVGLQGAATLRAADILLGPLNILFTAAVLLALPEGARMYASRPALFPRAVHIGGILFAAVALVCGGVILLLPTSVGTALVGPNWHAARPVMAPLAVHLAAVGLSGSWLTGMRIMEAVQEALVVRLILTPMYLLAAIIGMLAGDALGAAVGTAIVGVLGAVILRARFLRCVEVRSNPPSSGMT